jgi:hypothetical protein
MQSIWGQLRQVSTHAKGALPGLEAPHMGSPRQCRPQRAFCRLRRIRSFMALEKVLRRRR